MTTVAEFLKQTKPDYYIQKRAQGIMPPAASTGNYSGNPVFPTAPPASNPSTTTPKKNKVVAGAERAVNFAREHIPYADTAVRWGAGVLTGNNKPYAVRGVARNGANRYVQLAQRMFGGDRAEDNPYLDYFRNVDSGYTDQQFLYDLSEIMKSNPKVADVMMRNAMNGDTSYADMLYSMGQRLKNTDPAQATKLLQSAQRLYGLKGKLGKTFVGPSMMGGFLYSGHTGATDAAMKGMESMAGATPVLDSFRESATKADFGQYTDAYNKNIYKPLVQDQYYAHNFYGALNNPAAQGAIRYGAPWLAYGVPIAGAMSMMGNNGAWPIVLGGGALSMLYGGATGAGHLQNIANSPFGQSVDQGFTFANQPVGGFFGNFNATAPITGTLTGPRQFGSASSYRNNGMNSSTGTNSNFSVGASQAPQMGTTSAPGPHVASQTDDYYYTN